MFLNFRVQVIAWPFCLLCLIVPGRLFAQAAPGPLHPSQSSLPSAQQPPSAPKKKQPEIQPRATIAGFWKLNQDESDDPRQKLQDARHTNAGSGGGPGGGPGNGPGGGMGRPGGIGFPYPGGGGGGNGPSGGRGGSADDDEARYDLLDMIRPADSLTIELKEPEVDLLDQHMDKLVIYSDGRKIEKSKNDPAPAVSARWNGNQLVTDEKSPKGRKMSRTLELSPDGKQFYETWRIENRRSDSATVIRYVYDAAIDNLH